VWLCSVQGWITGRDFAHSIVASVGLHQIHHYLRKVGSEALSSLLWRLGCSGVNRLPAYMRRASPKRLSASPALIVLPLNSAPRNTAARAP